MKARRSSCRSMKIGVGCGVHGTRAADCQLYCPFFCRGSAICWSDTKGGERFARFLVAWHNFVGTLACNPERDEELEARWSALTNQLDCEVSRSALVFAVASASYTFLQQQVGISWNSVFVCKHRPSI